MQRTLSSGSRNSPASARRSGKTPWVWVQTVTSTVPGLGDCAGRTDRAVSKVRSGEGAPRRSVRPFPDFPCRGIVVSLLGRAQECGRESRGSGRLGVSAHCAVAASKRMAWMAVHSRSARTPTKLLSRTTFTTPGSFPLRPYRGPSVSPRNSVAVRRARAACRPGAYPGRRRPHR